MGHSKGPMSGEANRSPAADEACTAQTAISAGRSITTPDASTHGPSFNRHRVKDSVPDAEATGDSQKKTHSSHGERGHISCHWQTGYIRPLTPSSHHQ